MIFPFSSNICLNSVSSIYLFNNSSLTLLISNFGLFMMSDIIFNAFGFSVLKSKYLQSVITKLFELFFWLKNIVDLQLIPCKPTPLTPYLSPLFLNIFLSLMPFIVGLHNLRLVLVVFWHLDSSKTITSSISKSIFDVFLKVYLQHLLALHCK